MIVFSHVHSHARIGSSPDVTVSDLSMTLPTDRRFALLVQSAELREDIVELICGLREPRSGLVARQANVSYPMGFASGLYAKLDVVSNIRFVASLFGIDQEALARIVIPLLPDEVPLRTKIVDLPSRHRMHLSYCLSYALPFETYVAKNTLIPNDPELRHRLKPLVEERLRTAGLILVTSIPYVASSCCDEAAVLHASKLMSFRSVKDALTNFKSP